MCSALPCAKVAHGNLQTQSAYYKSMHLVIRCFHCDLVGSLKGCTKCHVISKTVWWVTAMSRSVKDEPVQKESNQTEMHDTNSANFVSWMCFQWFHAPRWKKVLNVSCTVNIRDTFLIDTVEPLNKTRRRGAFILVYLYPLMLPLPIHPGLYKRISHVRDGYTFERSVWDWVVIQFGVVFKCHTQKCVAKSALKAACEYEE